MEVIASLFASQSQRFVRERDLMAAAAALLRRSKHKTPKTVVVS
jgi:hypothetical protein